MESSQHFWKGVSIVIGVNEANGKGVHSWSKQFTVRRWREQMHDIRYPRRIADPVLEAQQGM